MRVIHDILRMCTKMELIVQKNAKIECVPKYNGMKIENRESEISVIFCVLSYFKN